MDDKQREEMNAKIDVLFEQIHQLPDDNRRLAVIALGMWKGAKTYELLGLGPATARHEYKAAYYGLKELGLEVGGMLPPIDN